MASKSKDSEELSEQIIKARFHLADLLTQALKEEGFSEKIFIDRMHVLGTRETQNKWAASRGLKWNSDGKLVEI